MKNLITDISGLGVGHAQDERLGSGVTALIFESPAVASIAVHGGAAGLRDTGLLEPEMTVERIDALVLSGGSVYGLDSMGGVVAFLRESGRGFAVRDIKVPIVPGAVLFDLLNGGDKNFGREPIYWHLGYQGRGCGRARVRARQRRRGLWRHDRQSQGRPRLGERLTSEGFRVGALVAVNAVGRATIGEGPHFWAAPYEQKGEFGGLGWPAPWPLDAVGFPHQGRRGGKHHHCDRCHRRGADQTRGQASGHHGA